MKQVASFSGMLLMAYALATIAVILSGGCANRMRVSPRHMAEFCEADPSAPVCNYPEFSEYD